MPKKEKPITHSDLGHLVAGQIATWSHCLHSNTTTLSSDFRTALGFEAPLEVSSYDEFANRFAHPDDRPLLDNAYEKLLETGTVPPTEYRWINPADGEVRWQLCHSKLEVDDAGAPTRIYGIVQDITRLKLVEQELRETAAWFGSLTEASPALIFRSDEHGGATFFNDARWIEFTGLGPGSWQGDGWLLAIHPDDRQESDRQWREGVAAQAVIVAEDRFLHVNGELRHILFHAHPIYADGIFTGHIGTGTDITELRVAQGEQDALRTALLEAKKLEAIGTLASGVAHDFNNQLMAINGYLELASLKLDANSDAARLVQKAREATHQAGAVTEGLLTFGRRGTLDLEPVDVSALTRRNTSMLQKLLPANIDFSVDVTEDPLWV